MRMKFYIAYQLFSQWKNIFLCPEDIINSYAACDLLKVLEFSPGLYDTDEW